MKKQLSGHIQLCLLLTSCLLLSACSNSDTSSPESTTSDDLGSGDLALPTQDNELPPLQDPPAQGSFNGGFTGRLIASIDGSPKSIDLATGQQSDLPTTVIADTMANNPNLEFEDSTYSEIHASDRSADAALIHTYLRCVKLDDIGLVENACYTAYSSDFSQLGALKRLNYRELEVGARLSPSRQKAVTVDYFRVRREDDDLIHIEIWNVATGDRETLLEMKADTSGFFTNRQGAPAVDWGHDDGLIYTNAASNPPTVFITEPGSYEIIRTIKLPSRFQGIVDNLFLSPDGTRLLLDYERHGYNSGRFPIVLDLQSLEVTIPVRQAYDPIPLGDEGSNSRIRALGWSPDSNWILVGHHTPLISDAQTFNLRFALSAVPASSEYAVVSGDESELSPGVVLLKFYDPDQDGSLSAVDGEYQYVWLP